MPGSNDEFQLLFNVQESGNGTRDLNARLQELYKQGYNAADAMKKLGANFDLAGQAAAAYGNKVTDANDKAARSFDTTARAKAKADAEMQRSANAAFQTNMRIWQQQQAESRRTADEEQRNANAVFQLRMRLWKQEEAERKRIASEQEADRKRQEAQQSSGIRGASMVLGMGGRGAGAFGTALGGGIGGTMGGLAIGGAIGGAAAFTSMVRDAAQSAQALQNLSNEFGISTQRAFQLRSAANLVGVDFGTLAAAAKRLSEALEDPGGAGKKTAQDLVKAGVDIRGSLGDTLDAVIAKLKQQKSITEENVLATQIFGRQGAAVMVPVANALDQVNQKLDMMTQQRLVAANRAIQDFGNSFTVLEGRAASAFLSVSNSIQTAASVPMVMMGNLLGMTSKPGKPFEAMGPKTPAGNWDALSQARTANPDKHDINEQIADLRKKLSEQELYSDNDRQQGRGESQRLEDQKKEADLRSQIQKLEAKAKTGKDSGAAVRREDELMAELRDRKILQNNPGMYRPLGEAEMQQARRLRQIANDQYLTPAQKRAYTGEASQLYGQDIAFANQSIAEQQREVTGRFEDYARESYGKSGQANARGLQLQMRESLQDAGHDFREQRAGQQEDIRFQTGQINRGFAYRTEMRRIGGNDSPTADYSDAINQAQQLYQMRLKEIQLDTDDAQQRLDSQKAFYDFVAQSDEARMQREQQIAKIGQQQQQEGGRFVSGWVMAALSGQPSASTNYLRGFGQDIFGKIVGNTAGAAMGPGGMNRFLGLGDSGVLGTPDKPSFIGQMLKGTPFDFSSQQLAKLDPNKPLISSQDALKQSVDANTVALGGRPPATGGSSVVPGLPSGIPGSVSSMMHAISGGNPSSIMSSAAGLLSSMGGGSAGAAASSLSPFLLRGGGNTSSSPFSSPFSSLSALLNAPGGTSGFVPGAVSDSGAAPNASLSVDSVGGGSPAPSLDLSSFYRDAVGVGGPSGGITPAANDTPSIGDRIAGGANKLSGLIGNTGRMLGSGNALSGILTGNIDYGDGTGAVLTDSQRVAGGIGLAGATYAGVSTAVKDFGKGGSRGITGGIGSSLGTAALFDPDPLSKTALMAGSAIMGLVQSLLPDPRQERIKQESSTLVSDAFIRPAAKDYNFAGAEGSQGFSMGMGGRLQAGGPSANNQITYNLHTLDAKSMLEYFKENPNLAGNILMTGMTDSGIAAIGSQQAFNSTYGGYILPGGLTA